MAGDQDLRADGYAIARRIPQAGDEDPRLGALLDPWRLGHYFGPPTRGVLGGMIRRLLFGFGVVVAFAAPALAELAMTGAPVAMRAAPSNKAQVVQRIPASAEIELSKCARGWRQASWRNRSGYIPCDAVVLGPPPATLPGNEMPPPVVNVMPTYPTPPVWRWTGAYVGTNFGFGSGDW